METIEKQLFYEAPYAKVILFLPEDALCAVSDFEGFGDESDWDQEG